jgi:cell division protein FtsI (penicillin-binding protein 3)
VEVSSNIALAKLIDNAYSKDPKKFTDKLRSWNLHLPLGLPIQGEGAPIIPEPGDERWSKNALPSIAYGYNLQLTPLQILTFYNAIANDGVMVKPQFIEEVGVWSKEVKHFEVEVINPKIASEETISQIQEILKNVVKRGTGQTLYSEHFSMAGKTGTARTEYGSDDWEENRRYVSSFAGYFPADNPKYSCIVVINKPSVTKGYYGADVTGPVFKRIAQKIFTDSPRIAEVTDINADDPSIKKDFETYYPKVQRQYTEIPNVTGMAGMDAISLLENLGLKVKVVGNGTVIKQSIPGGEKLVKGKQIILNLS